jgi:hypothetical protein
MKQKILTALILIFSAGILNSQTLNLRFSTYFYSWQRLDSINDPSSNKTTHIQGYQDLFLDVNKDKWSFNTMIQTDEDVLNRIDKGFHYRFYNIYVKGTNLFNHLDLKLGRQYVFAGVGKGPVDGLYLKIKAGKNKEYQLSGFGGYATNTDYAFDKYYALKDNYSIGGQFSYYGVKDLVASASYSNMHHKPLPYNAFRIDSLLNTHEVLIDLDSPTEQFAGLDFDYSYQSKHYVYGKLYYDINQRMIYRGEINARVRVIENFNLSAGYLYRQPQISYNSIFWVFEHNQYQEIEGGADYTLKNGMNLFGKVSDVIYTGSSDGKNNSLRLQLGFNNPSYGLSYVKYTGYTGESDGASGYIYREIVKSILSASASLNFSRYRLEEYTSIADGTPIDRVNSLSGMLGLTYRPMPQLSIDAQGQFIQNRIYKVDTRFLVGLTYWLFKNFKKA